MEVILDKQYPAGADIDSGWAVLSDMQELATCMPGARITEEIDPANYKGDVRVKVGPAVAAFAGTIHVLSIDEATRTVRMVGKGADKGGSSASMELTASLVEADNGGSTLKGHAEVIVNGKFAQFGGRMMGSVSDMLLAQFAETFSQKAQEVQRNTRPATLSTMPADLTGSGAASPPSPRIEPEAAAAPVAAREIDGLSLLWALIRNFFAGLFGRKP